MTEVTDKLGYMRLKDVLNVYPVGKSTWWAGIKKGRYPQPHKISQRLVAWRREDIMALIERSEGI